MYVASSSADLFWLHSQFSRYLSLRSSNARPVFGLMTQVCVMNSRTSFRLSRSSRFDHPGMSRSIHPTHAGYGMHEYFPLIPRSPHHSPNSRTKESGISRQLLPVLLVPVREDLGEVRDAEVGQVH